MIRLMVYLKVVNNSHRDNKCVEFTLAMLAFELDQTPPGVIFESCEVWPIGIILFPVILSTTGFGLIVKVTAVLEVLVQVPLFDSA